MSHFLDCMFFENKSSLACTFREKEPWSLVLQEILDPAIEKKFDFIFIIES